MAQGNQKVSIEIKADMYTRFQSLPYKLSTAVAEFIDNAVQSARDNIDLLKEIDPNYKLRVDIKFGPQYGGGIIGVIDNAAGIDKQSFSNAFMPAQAPKKTSGLNEYGMGMKTAAYWLGNVWCLDSRSIKEDVRRSVIFNLNEIVKDNLKEVNYDEEPCDNLSKHGTSILIVDASKNMPKTSHSVRFQRELASIYRDLLRSGELELYVNDEQVFFDDYDVLEAPFVRKPDGENIKWKTDVYIDQDGYKIKGFVGILKEMDGRKNGFVIKRRGRVITGEGDTGRYYPSVLCGQSGSPRYKRIFGELEVEGFDVSFNKNEILNIEILESLLVFVKDKIHQPDFDMLTQAEEFRLESQQKHIDRIIKKHEEHVKSKKRIEPPVIETSPEPAEDTIIIETPKPEKKEDVKGAYEEEYYINDTKVKMTVKFIEEGEEGRLFSITLPNKDDNTVIDCNINVQHAFITHSEKGVISQDVVAMIKAMAITKYTLKINNSDGLNNFFKYFEDLLRKTTV